MSDSERRNAKWVSVYKYYENHPRPVPPPDLEAPPLPVPLVRELENHHWEYALEVLLQSNDTSVTAGVYYNYSSSTEKHWVSKIEFELCYNDRTWPHTITKVYIKVHATGRSEVLKQMVWKIRDD